MISGRDERLFDGRMHDHTCGEVRREMAKNVLGIDAGSISIGICELTPDKEIIRTMYRFHHGRIGDTLASMLEEVDFKGIGAIASTLSTPEVMRVVTRYDNHVAVIAAAKFLHDSARGVLNVGGEKFSLISFDRHGDYKSCRSNTSCAAGTGSFLDQQALRLDLKDSEELSRIALENTGPVPKIASRCAVFAKTDLIHAQQEGYSLSGICDGLCHGLARNIVDTVFARDDITGPLAFCGGVSKNLSVARHIHVQTGKELLVDEYSHVYGALGAGLCLIRDGNYEEYDFSSVQDILVQVQGEKNYFHAPLVVMRCDYPDFTGIESYEFTVRTRKIPATVEVDVYEELAGNHSYEVYLGVDVGSTSTKAVIMDVEKRVLAGFYTWTAGRPVDAVCAVCEAIDDLVRTKDILINIIGVGATGSGRKLIGRLMNADSVLDEITAHARAACELNPDVDTIIEIGGQDSKFTTLKNGQVTFSIMNTVCAAGTGSFIEEQASKMGCPLGDYSRRTEGVRSPISSDRCTVFMERDMNHYLCEGYGADEVLASALHSVCENYLSKVAIEGAIGDIIFFQGATAKNKSLVAAFEQRLEKPIFVSKFCHITGAYGAALVLADEAVKSSQFRGLDLYKEQIPVRSEVCSLCTNHCKITIAQVGGDSVAYGFLCGRDYDTQHYVNNNTSGFDLIRERSRICARPRKAAYRRQVTIGLPAALHLFEDLDLWQYFFDELSIRTIDSTQYRDALKEGKKLAGAEFCAPMAALHGHVSYLLDKADYVFVPYYFEERNGNRHVRRQYCYYTQFAPSLVSTLGGEKHGRVLTPLVNYLYNRLHTKVQLYKMLKKITHGEVSIIEVSQAFDRAVEYRQRCIRQLQTRYDQELKKSDKVSVVLLGRPYTILSPGMNKGIVDIFAARGIKVFYQDMLTLRGENDPSFSALLDDVPWKYAARILQAAREAAETTGVYPVLVTSFRCSPDSFVVEYFKRLMNTHDKPYLILQLDEHDSNVGYETRIEAAIRSFTNHLSSSRFTVPEAFPSIIPSRTFNGRTILFPNWDNLSCSLVVAALQREGLDVRLLEEQQRSIQKSLRYNTGQCIPINIMAQEFIDYIEKYDLDPARCILWMGGGEIACNLKLIPHHIKNILSQYGHGMGEADVYQGNISFMDISLSASLHAYFAFMFGGMLRRIGCKVRPYEMERGRTDRILFNSLELMKQAFSGNMSKEDTLQVVIRDFENIARREGSRPKAAIFGDLYVRDNDLANQDLIRFIEENGGEVITTPYSTYAKMIARPYFKKWLHEGKYYHVISTKTVLSTLRALERRYYKYFQRILHEPDHVFADSPEQILAEYNLIPEHTGESMDNIIKVHYIRKYYPDVALFIQTSPAFCCPSLITEAMARTIEQHTGIPVVCITYDGTCSSKNNVIIPYLACQRKHLDARHGRRAG